MNVAEARSSVEFDCAHGTIDEPLTLDQDRHFDAPGSFVREHGGPLRKDETENRQPARYQGSTDGTTMTLRVVLGEGGETLGPFTLAYGKGGRVVKCR